MVEPIPQAIARASYSLFLRRMAEANAGLVADAMGVSDSKVSELKTKQMQDCITLLAHLGLKVVPARFRCLDEPTFQFLTSSHKMIVQRAPELLWGDGE